MRVISQPAAYAAWFVVVLAALVVSYFLDPYIFAFTTLILGWVSLAVALLAIVACLVIKPLEGRRKLAILSFILLTGISVVGALALLRAFKWA